MAFDRFHAARLAERAERRWARAACVVLSLVVAAQTAALLTRPQTITLQPWTLGVDAEITRGAASRSYIEAWALALAELLGNVTPGNAAFVATRVAPLLDPAIYHAVVDKLEADAEDIRAERIAVRFEPRGVLWEKSTGRVFVEGFAHTRLGLAGEPERQERRTYEFEIRIDHYAPVIRHLSVYPGEPRTTEVERRSQAKAEKAERAERDGRGQARRRHEPQAELMASPAEAQTLGGKEQTR